MTADQSLPLIFFVSLFTTQTAVSQHAEPKFSHISAEEGLSHLTVTKVVQDSEGFLWVGTEHGLNRYDGFTFSAYYPDPADEHSIGGFSVTDLSVDRDGVLWIGLGEGGLNRYDADEDRFIRLHPPDSPGTVFVGPVCASADGSIWFGSLEGLWRYHPGDNRFEHFGHRDGDTTSLSSDLISSLVCDADGGIWVGTRPALDRFDPKTGQFTHYRRGTSGGEPEILSLARDRQGVVWAGSARGLLKLDPVQGRFIPQQQPLNDGGDIQHAFVQALFADNAGQLWIGTRDNGVLKRNPGSGTISQYVHDPANPRSLDRDRVDCIYQDRSGVIWVGTYRGGLNKCDPRQDHFVHYRIDSEVYAVYRDSRGDLWLGTTEQGLLRYPRSSGRLTRFMHDPRRNGSIASDLVTAIQEDRNGDLWVGTARWLDRFSRTTETFRHYDLSPLFSGTVSDAGVKSIHIDGDGELWVGTLGIGLARYERKQDRFVLSSAHPEEPDSLSGNGVWALEDAGEGKLWVGTFGAGISVLDKATGKFSRIPGETTAPVYAIEHDASGNFWIGTFGSGLVQLDAEGQFVRQYTTRDGLPDDYVKALHADANGNIWLSTDKGLARLNPSGGDVRILTQSDGLLGNVFLSGSLFSGKDGMLYFGGEGGVTAFHPDSIRERSFRPDVAITQFNVFEKPLRTAGRLSPASAELSHSQNFFSFEFVAFDYAAPAKNRYRYMLEGVDHEWVDAGTRRYANYTNVPPGSYLFRVQASNSDGVWSGGGVSMPIAIAPPFWATWWFRISALVALVALAVVGYNYRVNRLLEIERLRVRIASDLHDEVGSSLTRISLQSELMREGVEKGDINAQLTGISQMSRDLVTTISDIVWSIDARNDTLDDLLTKMKDFASSTLSARQIHLLFSHSGLELKKKIAVDRRENIYLIYKEIINNIARHSDATEVRVVLRNDYDKFTLVVVENGRGWDGDVRPSGHGIRNMTMRAERLGGNIVFAKQEGIRTVLTLKPL